jgi:glyoxylate utilization-related uncharacterized protein
MAVPILDSAKLPRTNLPGAGEFTHIISPDVCGAKNFGSTLRWLRSGDSLDARPEKNSHQLLYLIEGEATITVDSREHSARKGSGVYLGPSEGATITHKGSGTLKLLHLVVPILPT